jgi:hypothetical protein
MITSQLRSLRKLMREGWNNLGHRKDRIKGCLKGGSGKKPEKAKKMICGKFKCPNCDELGHRKNSPKCPLNGTKKRQVIRMSP